MHQNELLAICGSMILAGLVSSPEALINTNSENWQVQKSLTLTFKLLKKIQDREGGEKEND